MIRVSAIVSTYNSERFFRGRIADLMAQSLFERGELEIVVVNAGSRQSEAYYIAGYLKQGIPLTVITSLREPLYTSWNRGIRIAQGTYITNANTDDRLCPDALSIMADALDNNPDRALVYGDSFVTPTPNAVWGGQYELNTEAPYGERLAWPDFDPLHLLQHCTMGPHPLWRKDIHETIGYFDESYMVAGDYEMWLRMAASGLTMLHIPDTLGLFYWHSDQLGRQQAQQSAYESRRAILKHRAAIHALHERPYPVNGVAHSRSPQSSVLLAQSL